MHSFLPLSTPPHSSPLLSSGHHIPPPVCSLLSSLLFSLLCSLISSSPLPHSPLPFSLLLLCSFASTLPPPSARLSSTLPSPPSSSSSSSSPPLLSPFSPLLLLF